MYLKSMYPDVPGFPAQNVHHHLFHSSAQKEWKNHIAHIDAVTGRTRSYGEFYEHVIDGATALTTLFSENSFAVKGDGGPGEIVAILGENSMDYIALVHSLLAMTIPFTMLSHYYTPFELAHALRLCKATRIFVQPKFLPLVQKATKDNGFPDDSIYIFEGEIQGRRDFGEMITKVRKNMIPRLAVRPAGKDTLAYLIFSSGTSGLPKVVMISHGNLSYTFLQAIVIKTEMTKVSTQLQSPKSRGLAVALAYLPLHHTYGLHVYCFRPFLMPTTLVLLPLWNVDVALKLIPKYKITQLSIIPSVAHQLVNSPKTMNADLSSLGHVSNAAAYLPDHLAKGLKLLTPNVANLFESYGLSEATLSVCTKPFPGILEGQAKNVQGSAGILLPGMEARILREDGSDAAINEPGELWVKGRNVALGYWNNEEANRETFVGGWLKTGDRFLVDTDGNFFFQDRAKDTLKISGMQVSPAEIENTLLAHPGKFIVDATVAGVSGGRTSDEKIPRAWVVLSDAGKQKGEAAVTKALDEWVEENLSKYKKLRGGIEVIKEIPKLPTGKVLRRVLQDEYSRRVKKSGAKL